MPKIKTKSSAKKRFKLTGTGKVRRSRAFHNHNLSYKPSHRTKRLRQTALVDDVNARQIRRMLIG